VLPKSPWRKAIPHSWADLRITLNTEDSAGGRAGAADRIGSSRSPEIEVYTYFIALIFRMEALFRVLA
jgi:hypothetical protein